MICVGERSSLSCDHNFVAGYVYLEFVVANEKCHVAWLVRYQIWGPVFVLVLYSANITRSQTSRVQHDGRQQLLLAYARKLLLGCVECPKCHKHDEPPHHPARDDRDPAPDGKSPIVAILVRPIRAAGCRLFHLQYRAQGGLR